MHRAARIHGRLETARDSTLPRSSGLSEARANELVSAVRAARQCAQETPYSERVSWSP